MRFVWSALLCLATPVAADDADFVRSNLTAILYHEFGHALIDILGLPVFGQEEDAADVASILLIDALYEEAGATDIAIDAAFGFLAEAEAVGDEIAWWDVHGPDLQRYYNLVCLFAGADLESRSDIALELDLPQERLDSCGEEFDIAYDSWGPVLDEISGAGQSMTYVGPKAGLSAEVVSEEVAVFNDMFHLSEPLEFRVEPCGEANAYYDPEAVSITLCTEFEDWLFEQAPLTRM